MSRPTAAEALKQPWISKHMDASARSKVKSNIIQRSERTTQFQKFLAMQKLKKAALVLIAGNLTQAEVGDLGEMFRRIDKEGDGVMTLTELDDAMSRGTFFLKRISIPFQLDCILVAHVDTN